MNRVFLDATCWVAAAGSPTGVLAQILKLGRIGKLVILATQRVLQEVEENICFVAHVPQLRWVTPRILLPADMAEEAHATARRRDSGPPR